MKGGREGTFMFLPLTPSLLPSLASSLDGGRDEGNFYSSPSLPLSLPPSILEWSGVEWSELLFIHSPSLPPSLPLPILEWRDGGEQTFIITSLPPSIHPWMEGGRELTFIFLSILLSLPP